MPTALNPYYHFVHSRLREDAIFSFILPTAHTSHHNYHHRPDTRTIRLARRGRRTHPRDKQEMLPFPGNKENAPPQRCALPVDHRKSLVTCSFRAAKVFPDHKRPHPRSDGAADESTRPPKLAARLPLSEVRESPPTTTLLPVDSGEPMLRPTPPPSGPVLLEDDFDEAVLREIDEICDRRSATKGEKPERECSAGGGVVVEDGEALQEYVEYWKKLNGKQREAACSDISVPLMIVAGPGSGKTSTMVGRVLMLLKEGIPAKKILAMTFTTAAAAEMRDRIGGVVGKAVANELEISTFHSFCLQLCRLHADKLGRTTEFVVYGHGQQRRAIIEAMRVSQNPQQDGQCFEKQSNSNNVDSLKERSKKWEKFVTQAKASGKAPDDLRKMGDELGATILSNYNDILTSCNALDYHDFITSSVMLLTEFPEVFKQCQELRRAIVVDEFQDTSSMQYKLLKILGSHHYLTVIGDEDQSIFSFNGADICGFDSFRKDFPNHKEIRLTVNYRSTRCIVEAASSLIHYNIRRCQSKCVDTDNSSGCKIAVKECNSEAAQCACVADKILEIASTSSLSSGSFGEIAVLYRRQVTGRAFQALFRERNIPFNVHGVAFYRKKVIKAIIAILGTTLPGCGDAPYRQSFKALLNCDKEEKKKVIEYIEKITAARKCSFFAAATDIFSAKLSGTFKRAQLSDGRRVLSTLDMLSKLVQKEQSITTVVSSTAAVIPQKYLLEKQAIVDIDGGKYLNEERDPRSALQYLLHDVSEFLSRYYGDIALDDGVKVEVTGCAVILRAFLDYICSREAENFRVRKCENKNSVTLTTIHQSKGLEWNTVFIVKANESEIPLLHEHNGILRENAAALEEERRLLYVAMTRARQKLCISYILMDSNWQLLQPSRFLREIPNHLIEDKADENPAGVEKVNGSMGAIYANNDASGFKSSAEKVGSDDHEGGADPLPDATGPLSGGGFSNVFLKGFDLEDRAVISHMFHQWAKKPAFQNVRRLLDKVGFVIDERLRKKTNKNKEILRLLKAKLGCDEAFQYAQQVLRWEQLPMEKRIHLMREKQEHFQKLRLEKSMDSSEATPKQISYLRTLGCTVIPTSRLHASHLIELYKSI